jgi:hypothetical protein
MTSRNRKVRALKHHAFSVWNSPFGKCLAPWECSNPPIRAHSIQRRGPLQRIAVRGHVIMPRQRFYGDSAPIVRFEPVGVGKASVFTGLCSDHDQELFSAIDEEVIVLDSAKAMFLHSYRAVLRELHVKIALAAKLLSVYRKKTELDLIDAEVPTREGRIALEHGMSAYETSEYKEQYDSLYKSEDYGALHGRLLDLGAGTPTIAVSSLFSVDELQSQNDVPRVAMTILPAADGHTYAVLGWMEQDHESLAEWLGPILESKDLELRRRLSHLVIERCDNLAICPTAYEHWSDAKRKAILGLFERTIFTNAEYTGDGMLDLFEENTV